MARQFAIDNADDAGAASKLAEVQAAFERGSNLFGGQIEILRRSAEMRALFGETDAALKLYRRAIQLAPDATALLEEHLRLVDATQEFEEAIDFYTGLVDTPALSRWYRSRAHELFGHLKVNKTRDFAGAVEQYAAAEKDFKSAAKLDPALAPAVAVYMPTLRAYRGHALTLAEKFADAESALLAALDLDPAHAEAIRFLHELQDSMWTKLGGEGMPKDKLEEMRALASRVCTVEPKNAANWNNWGLMARDCAKYEESYLAYRRSIDLEPTNAGYLNDTALILLYHLGRDFDRAELWLTQAIECAEAGMQKDGRATASKKADETALGDAYGNLINVLQQTDRKEDAIARLRELEQKLPTRSEVSHWKQRLLPDEWQAEQDQKAAEAAAKAEAATEAATSAETVPAVDAVDELPEVDVVDELIKEAEAELDADDENGSGRGRRA